MSRGRLAFGLALLAVVAGLLAAARPAQAVSPNIVISQVYGGGGNTGATLRRDFIELFNRGTTDIVVTGWSVQYASTTGSTWQRTLLSGTIPAGGYYLVGQGQGTGGSEDLPPPVDASGSIPMSATAGKVVLRSTGDLIASGTLCPTADGLSVDIVGYGAGTSCSETAPTATLSNTTAAIRGGQGCTDTDNNSSDFATGAPAPRNSGTTPHSCGGGDTAPSVTSTSPASGATGVGVGSNVSITFSEPVNVAGAWFSISCTTSGGHAASVSGGPQTYTLDPTTDFASSENCTVTVLASGVTDADTSDPPDNMAADHAFTFTTEASLPLTEIATVQGTSHLSSFAGEVVKVEGVVIAERGSNVWIQDPTPDTNPATSEALLVFGSSVASAVVVGDHVHVTGTVTEFRGGCTPSCDPGSSAFDNLTVTELASPSLGVTVLPDSPQPLPAATVIGMGGRVPPAQVIEDDATGNVETSGVFDPAQDGIDFYETLESMLVQVNNPVVVGPRANTFGEIFVLADDGAQGSVRTTRGGIVIRPSDFNPERIMLDDLFLPMPAVDVRDHFTSSAIGVMTYDFANFKIAVTNTLVPVDGGLEREVTAPVVGSPMSVATFNVENLDPSDVATMPRLASIVVNNLRSPDLIGIEEMQDNSGATNDGTTAANLSWQAFIDAIVAAGGPLYDYRQIDPQNNADGGQPGGNIRVGFLFRTDRPIQFMDRGAGDATTPTHVFRQGGSARLTHSPGRVDPLDPAWEATRKPLAGEFKWRGRSFIAIVNHFSSKGGDDPLFGRHQPPVRSSEIARHQQAASVNEFVDEILAADSRANVIVLGDINDFEFSETTQILTAGGVLTSLMQTLPQAERYSYVFEGNSQVLDQILFSDNLMRTLVRYDVVHVNAEFADQASDHDPSVAVTEVRN